MKARPVNICFLLLLLFLPFQVFGAAGNVAMLIGRGPAEDNPWLTANSSSITFQPAADTWAPSYDGKVHTATVKLGDVNNDGYMDVVTREKGYNDYHKEFDSLHLYLGATGNTFTSESVIESSISTSSESLGAKSFSDIALGDMDGDGDLDLVVSGKMKSNAWFIAIYENDASGSFTCTADLTVLDAVALPDGVTSISLSLGDLDGDNDLDVATALLDFDNLTKSPVYFNDGEGRLNKSTDGHLTDGNFAVKVEVADIDDDGDLDILLGKTGDILLYRNRNNTDFASMFSQPETFSGTPFGEVKSIATGDMDGDGDLEVVTISEQWSDSVPITQKITIFTRDHSTGAFAQALIGMTPNRELVAYKDMLLADTDGDGDLDINLAMDSTTQNWLTVGRYLNQGNGSYSYSDDYAFMLEVIDTHSLAAFHRRKIEVHTTGLPEHLKVWGENSNNGFLPAPEFFDRGSYGELQGRTFESKGSFISAPRVIEDTNNDCYYLLSSWYGTGDVPAAGKPQTVLAGENEVQKIRVFNDSTITWVYEKVHRLEVITLAEGGSRICADSSGIIEPATCIRANLCSAAPGATCVTDASSFSAPGDPQGYTRMVYFLPPNSNITLSTLQETPETSCAGLTSVLGDSPNGLEVLIEGNSTYMASTLLLSANTRLSWNYGDAAEVDVGTRILPSIPPECAATCAIDTTAQPQPDIIIADSPNATVENSFYRSEESGDLYLTRPVVLFEVKWPVTDPTNCTCNDQEQSYITTTGLGQWPDSPQQQIQGAPVSINGGSAGYSFQKILFSEQSEEETAISAGIFNPQKNGKNVILFKNEAAKEAIAVVKTIPLHNSEADPSRPLKADHVIGSEITGSNYLHADPQGKNGYVYNELSYYDGAGEQRAYDRATRQGQIFPVNVSESSTQQNKKMIVVWYQTDGLGIGWPVTPVDYTCRWPIAGADNTIIIADGLGTGPLEGDLAAALIYNQADPGKPGFNPNEEHAIKLGATVYALRDDLNKVDNHSEPWVLLKYRQGNDWQMKVYQVDATEGVTNPFFYSAIAGQRLFAPSPLNKLESSFLSHCAEGEEYHFRDHRGDHWAKSSSGTTDTITMRWFYPLREDFYYPADFVDIDGTPITPGDPIPFLNLHNRTPLYSHADKALDVKYTVSWPQNAPKLLTGETLVTAKYGLPEIGGMGAAQVIFDESLYSGNAPLVKLYAPLAERKVALGGVPTGIETENIEGRQYFPQLRPTLKSRLSYDPINKKLVFNGQFNEGGLGEPLLLPNVMTLEEWQVLDSFDTDSDADDSTEWNESVKELFHLTRNPNNITIPEAPGFAANMIASDVVAEGVATNWGIPLGLELRTEPYQQALAEFFPDVFDTDIVMEPHLTHQNIIGQTMGLTAGMATDEGWVVVAENNDPSLGAAPVKLHVIQVGDGPYRGELKVIKSDNVFDEKLTLRHTGDFAGEPEKVFFQWYYQPDATGIPPLFPSESQLTDWQPLTAQWGWGKSEITIEGAGPLTLADNWIIARYYYGYAFDALRDDTVIDPQIGEVIPLPASPPSPQFTETENDWSDWSGSPGNQTAQLAEGWIKRVIDDLNPLEARVRDFRHSATNTTVSMLSQLGERTEGDIALNSSAENLNNVGLIEAYQTVLDRGKDFSIEQGDNYGPVNNALLNASTRLADFYTLLGNEAYADAIDPTIGFDTQAGEFGSMMPSIFAFQNQLNSLLDEELALLRGRDDAMATTRANPVYNRLIWNYTRGIGEVAYATCYNVSDMDNSGVINEYDAQDMFPQGHGDAWGHYLTAMSYWYQLLLHKDFTWEPRIEAVLVGGAPVPVDYQDERQFAATAAAKAKVGAEIVDLTYRKHYVDDPAGQWQGYKDTDEERAWGVDGWSRRAGQGAFIDWAVANAILPPEDVDHTGIQKIDRSTVKELKSITTEYYEIQNTVDAADNGLNPAGLAKGVVSFDIDPSLIAQGETHFEQIHNRAVKALNNASTVFKHANDYTRLLRANDETLDDFKNQLEDQERGYLNRLIEIFGYPYEGDIGPGGFYPSGYNGPDWVHFMYMDLPDLTGVVSDENAQIKEYTTTFNFDTWDPDEDLGITSGSKEVSYAIPENSEWFAKPDGWGERRAPGDIQMALAEMIKADAAFKKGLEEYKNSVSAIDEAKDTLEQRYGIFADQISIADKVNSQISTINITIAALQKSQAVLEKTAETIEDTGEAVAESMPTAVGFSTDATAPARGAAKKVASSAAMIPKGAKIALEGAEFLLDLRKDKIERKQEYELFLLDAGFEVQQLISEMEDSVNTATGKLYDLLMLQEVIYQTLGRYRAAVAKGERLLSERAEIRARAAAEVQEYRYQDLGFRVFRNDAVQKYRGAFDLATQFTYLAATAYDYETNLLGDDYGAGREFLTEIVKHRSLGEIADGIPMAGSLGLGDPLARLSQNFEIYKTQLGFNNPQTETNRFSLRTEHFRLRGDSGSDLMWRNTLKDAIVDNLWDLPEFKKYCRPFAPEYMGKQPAVVIPFETMVTFGKNYFGWPLSGGDSSYDPTNFATKIRSVGIWFTGYNATGLSNTPRVYLIPTGADVLRSPSGDGFSLREWHVVDQKLPVPFPISSSDLTDDAWIPRNDSLSGEMAEIRRFSSFRAYHDSGVFSQDETIADSRLIGRSVWNTSWLLVIPGGTLLYDQDEGLEKFIDSISDIKLFFQTYAYSGN